MAALADRQLLDVPKLDLNFSDVRKKISEVRIDLDGTRVCLDEEEETPNDWRSWLKIVAPHFALVFATWLYTIIGATVFYSIEHPNESEAKNRSVHRINDIQMDFMDRMWNLTNDQNVNETGYTISANIELERLIEATFKAFEGGVTADDISNKSARMAWTFYSAVFFSTTVITTIGYGNLVPVTLWGKMFCICYALLGIPLTLVTIADIGKFVSSFIIWLYETMSKPVDMVRDFAVARWQARGTHKKSPTTQDLVESEAQSKEEGSEMSSPTESDEIEDDFESMPVPQSFVLFVLLSYTAFGALLFRQWEGWDFVDSFYFCLITMTTVGFGDLVPNEETYLLLAIVFIFIGLVLATMCIDTVGSHYIRKIHYFGRKMAGAHQVLAMIGGKALTMGDWMKHMKRMQKTYGLTDEEMRRMMLSPDEYINFIQMQQQKRSIRPYDPPEAVALKFIDQPGDPSPRDTDSTGRTSTRSSARTRSSYDNVVKHRQNVRVNNA